MPPSFREQSAFWFLGRTSCSSLERLLIQIVSMQRHRAYFSGVAIVNTRSQSNPVVFKHPLRGRTILLLNAQILATISSNTFDELIFNECNFLNEQNGNRYLCKTLWIHKFNVMDTYKILEYSPIMLHGNIHKEGTSLEQISQQRVTKIIRSNKQNLDK